jgi:type IV secretory pathway VirB2 component (pilin)
VSLQHPDSAITAAVVWARDALLGTVATAVAVICIAGIGFQLMTGRIPARRAVTVIVGCFILFGARGIASALSAFASGEPATVIPRDTAPQPPVAASPRPPSRAAPNPFDPYQGQ